MTLVSSLGRCMEMQAAGASGKRRDSWLLCNRFYFVFLGVSLNFQPSEKILDFLDAWVLGGWPVLVPRVVPRNRGRPGVGGIAGTGDRASQEGREGGHPSHLHHALPPAAQ